MTRQFDDTGEIEHRASAGKRREIKVNLVFSKMPGIQDDVGKLNQPI
jgi:hypothetical protein